jgi:hypothetical protein
LPRKFTVRYQSAGDEHLSSLSITTQSSDVLKNDSSSVQVADAVIRLDGVIKEVRESVEVPSAPAPTPASVPQRQTTELKEPKA